MNIKRNKKRITETGEVFTPLEYVKTMLEALNINWDKPPKFKTFLDPTCGEGVFLCELFSRGIPLKNIYGCDLMEDNVEYTKNALLKIALNKTKMKEKTIMKILNKNIVCENALTYDFSFGVKNKAQEDLDSYWNNLWETNA